ncbi:MAG: hypothetical protein H6732_06235 [Alphaproteobacteria bacterium]|nr:hypothetical protein [Alphaproteobacteria bacterium]
MGRGWLGLLVVAGACEAPPDEAETGPERPEHAVFPDAALVQDGHLALPVDLPSAATPVPVDRLAVRTGFSVVQTAVIRPGVALDGASLVDDDGLGGAVQLWDLTRGVEIRCLAELDAHPDADPPTLLVRPLVPVEAPTEVAVVVTTAVQTRDGEALAPLGWWQALLEDRAAPADEGRVAGAQALANRLQGLGVGAIAVAASWPVADGTAPLRAMVDAVPAGTVGELTVVEQGPDAELPDTTWRRATGSFTTTSWIGPDGTFVLGDDGLPVAQGTMTADLFVHVPTSVQGAAADSAPVWVFGHGIFSNPGLYLDDPADEDAVLALAEAAGAVVVATTWRGLTTKDFGVPSSVAGDFGRFPHLTDLLAQGVANTAALVRAVADGDLLDHEVFDGKADGDTLRYYGISLGGIEGAVLLALEDRLPHGVLHVGGSTWSTMLERSVHWTLFEDTLVSSGLDDPADRQLLYALSQLFWDPVDPASYVADLRGRSALWQVAVGDDQVSNLTSYTLARGVGASLLEPTSVAVPGLTTSAGGPGPVMVQLDPQEGSSDETNRPAVDSTAHEVPRTWAGVQAQTLRFLDAVTPGSATPACGVAPCTPAHTDGG